ncbi:spindle assembly abnormal protein 6 homolog [Dendronephthya gigantea]|uniref:spindle assembly abnormal protein 6 homolog n=1 Tax=Dendronephthya gigantea TaxID=151771 RepID=UPI00106A9804|nr:spindle assembly abnormal protein 6 homolog [Dendronephthya gigantea]
MEELFNKLLLVSLRNSSREERRVRLRVSVAIQSKQARGKELHVQLTDDEDPFFLFTLQLGEDDFQGLKSQQGLLVDFGAFPQNLMDLFGFCLEEESKDFPKFLLTFTISEHDCGVSHLNIVETNSFKHLTHLSLKFLLGNDVDVKKYLAGCLTSLKDENRSLKKELETTETELTSRLARSQEALAARNKELSQLRDEFSAKSSSIISKHSHDLATEREKALQMQTSSQKRFDEEKKELESSHKAFVLEMQNKLSKLTAANNELSEGKFRSESSCGDLKNKLSFVEEALQRSKVEVTKLRRDNTSLDVERHERDKTLNHLRTRIAVLEQENKDNQEVITRTRELLEAANEQKRKCEETIVERQQQLNKSEKTVKSISDELIKGNEIIHRLQKELRNAKAKSKLNATVITQQEKVLAEKISTLEKQNEELKTISTDAKNKDTEIKTLTESLASANEKLEENKQLLKTNENVINWLNKQINDQCLNQPKFGTANVNSASSNIGSRSSYSNLAMPHSTPLSVGSAAHPIHAYIPRYTSQAQVVYRPGHRIDANTPSIPEERLKTTSPNIVSAPSQTGKENNNPLIDPKYLTKPSKKTDPPRPPLQTKSLPKNPSHVPPVIPLMSAYFPANPPTGKNDSSLL